jgi:VirE N-terminal domain
MSFPEKSPARVGAGEGVINSKSQAERGTDAATFQADKSRAFAAEVSKNDAAIEAKGADNESGLGVAEDAELRNQLNVEVSATHIKTGMRSEEIIAIRGVIHAVKSGFFRKPIKKLRRILDKCGGDKNHPGFKAAKTSLDAVVIAGKIEGEIARAWERGDFEPSGFLQIDIDDLADPEIVREELRSINYILSAFVSPSGDGVKAIAYIGKSRDASDFRTRFEAVEKDMASRGYIIDTTCKNPNRLMFASWDADAWTRNSAAIPLKFPKSSLPPAKAKNTKPISKTIESPDPVPVSQELVKKLKAKSPMARNLFENGRWQEHSFPSQSEADFSLSCSICEITADPDQQETLFQTSALYRDERRLTLALKAARVRVAKDSAMPQLHVGG